MITYSSTRSQYPDVVIRTPVYFPTRAATSLSSAGQNAMQVLAYVHHVARRDSPAQLAESHSVRHLLQATADTEAWALRCLEGCDQTCSLRPEGEKGVSVSIFGGP